MDTRLNVGVLLFDNMTLRDGFGPLQVFGCVPQFYAFTFAREKAPVLSACPPIDVMGVPDSGDVLSQLDSLHAHLDTHPTQARA
jgi:hypothetical protein